MSSTITDRVQPVSLAVLEVIVLTLYLVVNFVDLSALDVYASVVGYALFFLVVVLLVWSVSMFSEHRRLAIAGLILVALVVMPIFFPMLSLSRR